MNENYLDWQYISSLDGNVDLPYALQIFADLHIHHMNNCAEYRHIITSLFRDLPSKFPTLGLLPYLPVSLFKTYDLISAPHENIVKCMNSSGTTGSPSKIFLDKKNAYDQKKSLSNIFLKRISHTRPYLGVLDSDSLIKNRSDSVFNARKAGVIGFSQLCRKPTFLLDPDLQFDAKFLSDLIAVASGKPIVFYGFTSVIWRALASMKGSLSLSLKRKLSNCSLIHGGGWKNLQALNVSNNDFKDLINDKLGISNVINYYGMIEQTGSIFMECEHGYLHENSTTYILPRKISDLSVCEEPGHKYPCVAQVFSLLPTSYPGFSLLTDDLIQLVHQDTCPCGRPGKAFLIPGRLQRVEVRGCSDSYSLV